MEWSEDEICCRMKWAACPARMLKIIAQCNAVPVKEIREILIKHGIPIPEPIKPRRKHYNQARYLCKETQENISIQTISARYGVMVSSIRHAAERDGFYTAKDGKVWWRLKYDSDELWGPTR